jgi:hypothetical protein
MLRAAEPAMCWNALAELPVGARDSRLLDLREAIFGASLECIAPCAHCAESLEFVIRTDEIRTAAVAGSEVQDLEHDGFSVRFRLPNGGDLVALCADQNGGDPELRLLSRCVAEAHRAEQPIEVAFLPATVKTAIAQRMAQCDPQAEAVLELRCPSCEERYTVVFDIVSHLWRELDAWARRMLREVHTLARAYGWREKDILEMSALRRRRYLDLLAG